MAILKVDGITYENTEKVIFEIMQPYFKLGFMLSSVSADGVYRMKRERVIKKQRTSIGRNKSWQK